MKRLVRVVLLFSGVLLAGGWALSASAAIGVYHFESTQQQDRFHQLTEDLRCPKCQNESIASSGAPIASDMRRQVADMIVAGKSDQQIMQYFIDRYGSFVSYRPPFSLQTAVLWVGPGVLLLCGLGLVVVLIRRASRRVDNEDNDRDEGDEGDEGGLS